MSNLERAKLGLKVAKRRLRDILFLGFMVLASVALLIVGQPTFAAVSLLCAIVQALMSIEATLYDIFNKLNAPDGREG